MSNNLSAIVLAAGKGERMNLTGKNKVVLQLAGKPMVLHGVELLGKLNIKPIIVVVGFAKESVIEVIGDKASYVEQKERLGSADAVLSALHEIPQDVNNVLVINGDDSAFYSAELVQKLINKHHSLDAQVTFLTIEVDNPKGLGRILRNGNGNLLAIVEDKDATDLQKKIKEINPQCFIFKVSFLKKYLQKIEKNKNTGEYYLSDIIGIAIKNNEKVQDVPVGKIPWRGINTKEELEEAERLFTTK
jgi:bifunctional N-acetylglucosamine-1-phosphate-uridyltransferase/glucosamine-1-phosphate-acetyltransferase GlmU-like protein